MAIFPETAAADGSRKLPRRLALFSDDTDLSDSLIRLSDGGDVPPPRIMPADAIPDIADQIDQRTELVLIDLEKSGDPIKTITDVAQATSAWVVGIGSINDVGLYRALRNVGAMDYVTKPLTDLDLRQSLLLPEMDTSTSAGERGGADKPKLNLVIGARNGVGTSTFALNLSWWIAERLKVQIGLVDLDLKFGSAALALDLLPGRGLRDALESPERIDPLFVGSAMVNATDNLFVLAAEEPIEDTIEIVGPALTALLDALTESFPCIVLDVPQSLSAQLPLLLETASTVTMVTDLSLAGLRDAIRIRDLIRKSRPDIQRSTIATLPPMGRSILSLTEFERGFEERIDRTIPWDAKLAARSAIDSAPMVARIGQRHAMAKAVAAIAPQYVTEANDTQARKRLWPW